MYTKIVQYFYLRGEEAEAKTFNEMHTKQHLEGKEEEAMISNDYLEASLAKNHGIEFPGLTQNDRYLLRFCLTELIA